MRRSKHKNDPQLIRIEQQVLNKAVDIITSLSYDAFKSDVEFPIF